MYRSKAFHRSTLKSWLTLAISLSLIGVVIATPAFTISRAARPGHDSLLPPPTLAKQTAPASIDKSAAATARAQENYGKVSLQFEANQGQTDPRVQFITRASGATVFLAATEAVFVLRNSDCGLRNQEAARSPAKLDQPPSKNNPQPAICSQQSVALWMKIEGARTAPRVEGQDKLPGIVNYFIGNDAAKWHTDIPTFGRVHYTDVYDGIDLVYYGNQQQLEYDFVVAPGADHSQIALNFEGADSLAVDAGGDLLIETSVGTLRQRKPLVYQEDEGVRREIGSQYEIKETGRIGFRVDAYDASRPLIIDPVLAYSTYLGGSGTYNSDGDDGGKEIAVDSAGNVYFTGETNSLDFPITPGAFDSNGDHEGDVFVTKLNSSGTALVYSTYFGSTHRDTATDIAVDSAGNAYLTGQTSFPTFPTTPDAFDTTFNSALNGIDGFVTKLNASGTALVYSTYLGGNSNPGLPYINFDSGYAIALDSAGNAYVAGETNSTDFPTTPGAHDTTFTGAPTTTDGFVAKLNASGSDLIYSTYLGGDSSSDFGDGIAVDAEGNAYVSGETTSIDFPTTPFPFDSTYNTEGDVFVTKLNDSGTGLVYSTYLGGAGQDYGTDIAVDSEGNAYVTGGTQSTDFPTKQGSLDRTANAGSNVFVTKLDRDGQDLFYSTYLGGDDNEVTTGIAVDSAGNAYVTGGTKSTDFPTTPGAFDTTDNPDYDAFVTKLNMGGSALIYSTYLGGSGSDVAWGIAVDPAGNTYVTGDTVSANFPVTPDAFQTVYGGVSTDAFVAKLGDYAISGRVIDSLGNGISGATVTLSGANSGTTTTDADGNFAFLNTTPDGNFTVTAFKPSFTFAPEGILINNLNANQELVFIGTPTAAATPTPTPTVTPTPTPTPDPAAVVQFSSASFGVSEGGGFFQIIATRSGDTTQPVNVDYATTDGTANDRGDYTTALGTLQFAAGDTAESFVVFINDDVYAEGNETINLALSNPSTGASLGSQSTVVLTIVDNDLVNGSSNPIDSTSFFVRQHYIDFLNREPDPAGLAYWINNIESCGADQGCRAAKRIDTSAAFFLSIEFQQTGFLVHRANRAGLNRLARYRGFLRDTQQIGAGVAVGVGNWEMELEQNKQAYYNEFVARSEFVAIYVGLTNEQYVDALNANTVGSLSVAERNALVTGLNGMTETRATVLRKVVEDSDFVARELNPAFVIMEYFGYLRRNPDDAPDVDFSGYNFWLAKLNQFNGDFRKAEMVKAFLNSSEYRQRFGGL